MTKRNKTILVYDFIPNQKCCLRQKKTSQAILKCLKPVAYRRFLTWLETFLTDLFLSRHLKTSQATLKKCLEPFLMRSVGKNVLSHFFKVAWDILKTSQSMWKHLKPFEMSQATLKKWLKTFLPIWSHQKMAQDTFSRLLETFSNVY